MLKMRVVATAVAAAVVGLSVVVLPAQAAGTSPWRAEFQSKFNGMVGDVVAISPADAWAAGELLDKAQNPIARPYVLHWNGARWSAVTIPGGSGYFAAEVLASSASNVWVLTAFRQQFPNREVVFRFDGRRWYMIVVPVNVLRLLVLGPANAWAVGAGSTHCTSTAKTANCTTVILHWNGSRWKPYRVATTVTGLRGQPRPARGWPA
jgi:hypothetical protein